MLTSSWYVATPPAIPRLTELKIKHGTLERQYRDFYQGDIHTDAACYLIMFWLTPWLQFALNNNKNNALRKQLSKCSSRIAA